ITQKPLNSISDRAFSLSGYIEEFDSSPHLY
ncbi:hypothetical protein CCACVL1_04920, partial [Corchorus capsularis]